jgi:dihydroneopterin aldolase
MSEQVRQFIDQIASGENAEAKETLENLLASKSFDSLEEYKKQIAQSVFGDKEETQTEVEVQETE